MKIKNNCRILWKTTETLFNWTIIDEEYIIYKDCNIIPENIYANRILMWSCRVVTFLCSLVFGSLVVWC